MKFITISKLLLVLIFPLLIFLVIFNFTGFNENYFRQKFSDYGINDASLISIHEKILNFVKGNNNELPNELNEREKQHLLDVRKAINYSAILLYVLIALFVILLVISALTLKANNYITNFVGKVLVFGGFLTIMLAGALLILIYFDFSSVFEGFHLMLFQQGTYTFDPVKEMLVRLYPEQLFMDLGLRISKGVFFVSIIFILIGVFLMLKSKSQKSKVSVKNHQS